MSCIMARFITKRSTATRLFDMIWIIPNKSVCYTMNHYIMLLCSSLLVSKVLSVTLCCILIEARSLYKAASSGPNFLYTTEHNYMDFNVDDNGLWVIYSIADSNNTHVAKVSICNSNLINIFI